MYFILKLMAAILILYLKSDGLSAIPIIERHKLSLLSVSSASTSQTALASTSASASSLSAELATKKSSGYQNNDNNISTVAAAKTTKTVITTSPAIKLVTEKTAAINALTINTENPPPMLAAAAKTPVATTATSTTHHEENKANVDGILFNHFPIDKDKSHKSNNQKYLSYNISNNSRHHHHSQAAPVVVAVPAASPNKPPYGNDLLPFDPNFEVKTSHEKSSNDDDDEIEDADVSDELDMGLGNILLNTFNSSDVNRFLIKYDSDGGNTCLLDVVKESLMWWSFQNGTLHRDAIFNFTTRNSYLDLSYRNITQDDRLYGQTRAFTYWHGADVIAFSAAQNNLTNAPFRTLSLMNATLKYLTLKGNQFAAYTAEMQKDAISRLLNDSSRRADNLNDSTLADHAEEDQTGDTHTYAHTTTPYTQTVATESTNEANTTEKYQDIQKLDEELIEYYSNRRKFKNYKNKILGNTDEGIAWATFPLMPSLLELDISNCHIEFVTRDAFKNLTSLRRLFLAHNKMLTIPADSFHHIQSLQYLDLSFTNVLDSDFQIPLPTLEAVYNLIYGVKIQQKAFQALPKLVYLDLSHTKLTRNSAMAFTHLGEKLRYMSLCYTSFPMVGNALFKNTALVGLDLSGNPYAAYNMIEDAFEGVSDTLKYLYFERSNIKDLTWLRYLENLRVLGLSGNNINSVSLDVFSPLKSLQLLDLSSNHIGNWYNRVFTHNEQLRVLNMRDNNVNIITSEMLRDFTLLEYLSLGDNNFVCDCLLRDLVDIAAANNKDAECSRNVLQEAAEMLLENVHLVEEYITPNVTMTVNSAYQTLKKRRHAEAPATFDMSQLLLRRHTTKLQNSYLNMQKVNRHHPKVRYATQLFSTIRTQSSSYAKCPEPEPVLVHEKLNSVHLKFQLLDYEDEHYWCFNETERLNFKQLNCQPRIYVEDLTQQLHTLTKYVVGCVVGVFAVSLLGVLIYLKRWHIHYYFSYLKSAALVSVAAKEAADQLNALAESDPNLVYDIFISYCQSDRQWVLEELLPNVEESGDISICMHERDFQIGLTILDNIVSCMDRSRTLMLIISSNFLLSHWCQFEMHLAQHRIFEVSKEHLILVFLEDIPRSKRPKTLQYLMEVKTYIKWPSTSKSGDKQPSADERKFFWKRLKRSLENIGLHPYPKARESHA